MFIIFTMRRIRLQVSLNIGRHEKRLEAQIGVVKRRPHGVNDPVAGVADIHPIHQITLPKV